MATKIEELAGMAVSSARALEITTHVIGGKWKGIILYHLIDGDLRFNQLRRLIPGITQRMLTLQLRELEKNGIIERIVRAETPPLRVDYRLSEQGHTLIPILRLMLNWGKQYQASQPLHPIQ